MNASRAGIQHVHHPVLLCSNVYGQFSAVGLSPSLCVASWASIPSWWKTKSIEIRCFALSLLGYRHRSTQYTRCLSCIKTEMSCRVLASQLAWQGASSPCVTRSHTCAPMWCYSNWKTGHDNLDFNPVDLSVWVTKDPKTLITCRSMFS